MGQTEATRQSDFITAPIAGSLCAITTGAASSLDLNLVGSQTAHNDVTGQSPTAGLVGHYAYFQAETGAVYVVFGATSASVTGANAPVATASTTNAAGNSFIIPAGQTFNFKITSASQWIGFYAAVAGILRIGQSSP